VSEKQLQQKWESIRGEVETCLDAVLPASDEDSVSLLYDAMHYSVKAGGKRLRPLLVVLSGEACSGYSEECRPLLLDAACAVEMIHTYSLIHDDLPAMDDDDMRRGRPTCHVQFNEATAILAGDGLQAHAFETISSIIDAPETQLKLIQILAHGAGCYGMVAGQAVDLWYEKHGDNVGLEQLRGLHRRKTGALIRASALMGATVAGATPAEEKALEIYGIALGLGFQVVDDILDVVSDSETLGKTAGKDEKAGKATYPSLLGLEGARKEARRLHDEAAKALEPLGEATTPLKQLATFLSERAF
jgi:geranylgeranyl diphosphate synthase, type II